MRQVRVEGEDYGFGEYPIDERERPPIVEIETYRKRFGRNE
jgi:hypothetical protein